MFIVFHIFNFSYPLCYPIRIYRIYIILFSWILASQPTPKTNLLNVILKLTIWVIMSSGLRSSEF
uniref:Uncharacterized protein n=1 Tax=Picea glauca TaxID=3330 RepID=A0A101LY14_PICGL|nr:hypothetical protein ABT39_MTgene5610 [Picea glauca]QHR87835.1 hypothetical protein Q903MT_gene1847 [Picea sitchensis]